MRNIVRHCGGVAGVDLHASRLRDRRRHCFDSGGERRGDRRIDGRERVGRDQQPSGYERPRGRQQHSSDPAHQARRAREPSHRVEARRQRDHAVGRHQAVACPNPIDAAIACRYTHRPAAVGAEREVDEAARHRGRRPARRSAGNAPGSLGIDRRTVMHILAVDAEGQFIAISLADQAGSGGEQALDRRCRALCGRMSLEPERMAVAGAMSGDVEHVLDGEAAAEQGADRAAFDSNFVVAAKRVERIVDAHLDTHVARWSRAGSRETVMRPRLKVYNTGANSATAISGSTASSTTRSAHLPTATP